MIPHLQKAIVEFNQQEYYACHDTLEAIWMEAVEPDKTFYQGILQVAVGCYHLGNSNWRGAVILLGEGLRKLTQYEPDYLDIDVSQLTNDSHELLVALQNIEPDSVAQFYQQLGDRCSGLLNDDRQLENAVSLPKIKLINNQK
jgi:predicted metal-dependent hydrolase